MNAPIVQVATKAAYVAALKLAHELALELCDRCDHDYHRDQVAQIESWLLEAGEKLPPQALAIRNLQKSLRDRLDPAAHLHGERSLRGFVMPGRVYREQDIDVSQCEFKACDLGFRVRCGDVVARLTLKECRHNGRHILRFRFADVLPSGL